jgi:tRNA dimethylallyltransferase
VARQVEELWILGGVTAAGKTELSLEWAEHNNAEIISCDSVSFYRGLDIGSAKPGLSEQQRVVHHGLNLADISEVFDVVQFHVYAKEKIRNILSRGKKVLIVGGSGFFLNGFLRPVVDDVDVSSEVRKRVLSIYESHGITSLIKELKIYNPEGFGDLDLNNPVRVIRSLERCIQSGKSLIDLQKNFMKLPVPYARFQKKMIWLDRSDGEIIERIEKRSQEMIYHGIIEETEEAVRAGIRNHPTLSGAVGYREVLDFLGVGGSKEELICSISKSTRKLVSKQRKWFRKHFPQGARFQINHQKSVEIDELPWCAGT